MANLWIRPFDKPAAKQITNFDSGNIEDFDVSPDGTRVVVARSQTRADAVLVRNFR